MKIAESKLTSKNLTTVPSPVRKALDLKSGDLIEWHIENNEIKVRKGEGK